MDSENTNADRTSQGNDNDQNDVNGTANSYTPDLAWMRGVIAALDTEYPDLTATQINDLSAMLFRAPKYRALAPNLALIQWQADMDAEGAGSRQP